VSKVGNSGPHHFIHYAWRRLRKRSETRLSRVEDPKNNPENSPAPVAGAAPPPAPFNSRLGTKAHDKADRSPRQRLDAQVGAELSELMRELQRPDAPFGVTARMAVMVGLLAFVALLFVIVMPNFRQPDSAASFSATVQQFTAALPPRHQPPSEHATRPAIAEFHSLLAPSSEPATQADHDQSDELLRQFMQWRQKTNSAANAQ
jgi:hypothetical protein